MEDRYQVTPCHRHQHDNYVAKQNIISCQSCQSVQIIEHNFDWIYAVNTAKLRLPHDNL